MSGSCSAHVLLRQLLLLLGCYGNFIAAQETPTNGGCRSYPGSHDWPHAGQWNHLNQSLDGQLLRPVPPGAICHPEQPHYDSELCKRVATSWSLPSYHTDNPISVMWDQYTNYSCLPNSFKPCDGNGYPHYVVNVTRAEHVAIAINFGNKALRK